MELCPPDLVLVFDVDPDLLAGLDAATAAHLRRRFAVRRLTVPPGPWPGVPAELGRSGDLGLLVLEGLLVRHVELAGRVCSEVVGPGDVIRPWDDEDLGASVDAVSGWEALTATSFARLDGTFAARTAKWPSITVALFERTTARCRGLVHQGAIAAIRHADTRVLLALWHLADRWGRVTRDGVVLPVPLTHRLIGRLTCLQRQTVSASVTQLTHDGRLARRADGSWVLHGDPPALARVSRPAPAPARTAAPAPGPAPGLVVAAAPSAA